MFISARTSGAKGDGVTDDTVALNKFFATAAAAFSSGKVAFLDAGYYKVTDTVYIPPNIRVVGEAMAAVIMGSGAKFSSINKPYPVVKIGKPGTAGYVEISDLIVATQGGTAGAVLIEYNLHTTGATPSGLWDVHTRVGGFAGSKLQSAQCPKTPNSKTVPKAACIAAHTSMHITKTAGKLYVENSWLWVADHDIESAQNTQINIYAGRGMLVESTGGPLWLVGTAVEHHVLYQYQLLNAVNVFMGQIQTETPYFQPNPSAPAPFTTRNTSIADPDFDTDCKTSLGLSDNPPCRMAWGLRILGTSQDVVVFGAGLYSFFNNYSTTCSTATSGENCQARIFWTAASAANADSNIRLYNLNTIGSVSMVTRQGKDVALSKNNIATFADTIAVVKV
jgi:hypothetical protein